MAEEGIRLTERQKKARRARNIAIALALAAFVAIVYVGSIARLGANVVTPPM